MRERHGVVSVSRDWEYFVWYFLLLFIDFFFIYLPAPGNCTGVLGKSLVYLIGGRGSMLV